MYKLEALLFYFSIYSFMGWILEGVFHLLTEKSFLRPNFLMSPIKPMYGFASLFLVILTTRISFIPLILAVFIIPTFIEYMTGWLMNYYFKTKFWDYSKLPFNYKGYICLKFSIYWGGLSLLTIFSVQPLMILLYTLAAPIWHLVTPLVALIIGLDFTLTLLHAKKAMLLVS